MSTPAAHAAPLDQPRAHDERPNTPGTLTQITRQIPPAPGRPWRLPLPVRLLLVFIHLRTNLTTRALAALFATSQSSVDRIIHHLVPVLASTLRPAPDNNNHPWIIDSTLIPVRDQSITAVSKNYRRSINTQIIICAHRRRVLGAGRCWPDNRNDVIVARHTVPDCSTAGSSSVTADTVASPPSPVRAADPTAASSTTTTTEPTGESPPASSTSSPESKIGKSFGNAAAATPSTQPPNHHRTPEPQNPQTITGHLLGLAQ